MFHDEIRLQKDEGTFIVYALGEDMLFLLKNSETCEEDDISRIDGGIDWLVICLVFVRRGASR